MSRRGTVEETQSGIEDLATSDSTGEQLPEVEDLSDAPDSEQEEVEVSAPEAAKAEAKAKAPKRGELPEGKVTPVGLAKILTERKMHQNKAGETIEVKPQMVYSYMKNSSKDDKLETHTIRDSNDQPREVFDIEDAIAWWTRKNERVVARKANAAEKAAKAAAKPAEAKAEGDSASSTPEEAAVEAE